LNTLDSAFFMVILSRINFASRPFVGRSEKLYSKKPEKACQTAVVQSGQMFHAGHVMKDLYVAILAGRSSFPPGSCLIGPTCSPGAAIPGKTPH
jgi:hypothetical protein